ncbi:alpha-galactosidase [Paenibacillus sp. PL2-23]|uniref:alpha-galactosidase n=1 Tax=Paenibacillus sp. PL2-23 TaxID=2100729 RepID=UPI0030F52321
MPNTMFPMCLEDCYVQIEGHILRIGNDRLERCWSFASGRPVNLSIVDKKNNKEWLQAEPGAAAFQLPGLPPSAVPASITAASCVDDDYGIGKPHLRTDIDMGFSGIERAVRFTVRAYPAGSFIRHELTLLPAGFQAELEGTAIQAPVRAGGSAEEASPAFQLDDNNHQRSAVLHDYCEHLSLLELHCRWEAVSFRDQTDTANNLVSKESGLLYVNERRGLRGNVMFLANSLHPSGLMVVKEGATPMGHLQDQGMDFYFQGKGLAVTGSGIGEADWADSQAITAYGVAIGVYDGEAYSGLKLLHDYHRSIRVHKPERDSFIMSNTWGDRSKDGRVCEAFLLKELETAAQLGIDILQIDDGWQKGVTSNSVHAAAAGGRWSDYYSGGGDFWTVHPERFPRGLAPVVELAEQLGIKLGLWYSPDSSSDYVHWEKDVETLLRLHQEYGIRAFKLDGIDIQSKAGEVRLLGLVRQVLQHTGGEVDFNLDTTAQQRLGYMGSTQYGNIFLENRYTDWSNYYPHWTLRNLWMLAPYVPAAKLQMEFLNVNRNQERYGDDPLAPAACGQLYACAVTAFANPLAWMELSGLDADQAASLGALLRALKPHHGRILAGHVLPIGEEPSGTGWTGLQSIAGEKDGYLLVIRERHGASAYPMKLWGDACGGKSAPAPALKVTELLRMDERNILAASASDEALVLEPDASGRYTFMRPAPFTFAIYRYEV